MLKKSSFFTNTTNIQNFNTISFTNNEEYQLKENDKMIYGKFNVTYNISKNERLETKTIFTHNNNGSFSNLTFNTFPIDEQIQTKNESFNQSLIYTNKYDSN